jgi:hypothetical protein
VRLRSKIFALSALPSKAESKGRQTTELCDDNGLISEPDTNLLYEARGVLASFSIIGVDTKTGNMTMHPLVHAWARDRLRASEIEEATVSAGCVLALSMYSVCTYDSFWPQLQPHVESY